MAKRPAPAKSAARPAKAPASKPRGAGAREVELRPDAPALSGPKPARRVGFGEIIGQDRALSLLRASIASDRIHHAWIFDGPPGIGKFTAALAFAGAILDPTTAPGLGGDIEPDPESPTQKLRQAGTHPDLHIITKELAAVSREASVRDSKQRTIAKDVLEEFLIEPAVKTSSSRGGLAAKVFIIDEAELIDARGQNALLKTLEEPAPGSVIILVTASEERLLPTIRSRCQRIPFAPLSDDDMQKWAKKPLGSGGTGQIAALGELASGVSPETALASAFSDLPKEEKAWLFSFAAGSPGMALLALDTGLVQWRRTLAPMLAELDRGRFPIDLGPSMTKLADEWAAAWVDRPGNENASKDAANKSAARQLFRLLADHYRTRLRAGAADPARAAQPLRAIDLIVEAEKQADSNVAQQFVFENLAAQLAAG